GETDERGHLRGDHAVLRLKRMHEMNRCWRMVRGEAAILHCTARHCAHGRLVEADDIERTPELVEHGILREFDIDHFALNSRVGSTEGLTRTYTQQYDPQRKDATP